MSLPSASVLAVLRKELAGRRPASKTVAVLADPVFTLDDRRVKGGSTWREHQEGELKDTPTDDEKLRTAVRDSSVSFTRLDRSREEAKGISALVPEDSRLLAMGFAANRATATSDDLRQYRIVHFATHGLVDGRRPELSCLVFSLVDEHGQPQNGFLRLDDIYNINLPADLVVLSACQTALGREVKGEGLIGLTRGFMYAGAASVAASLWNVEDRATAELMERFYEKMLVDRLSPAAALRAAQISMLQGKIKRWRNPFYWAGFVLQGEWK